MKIEDLRLKIKKFPGYSLIELILITGIFLILIGIGTISLLNIRQKASLSSTIDSFVADFRQQQIKAMSGQANGSASVNDQGVHFEQASYTLFTGTYGNNNFVINLPDNIQFVNSNTQVLFEKGSGNAVGINSIVLKNINDGSQKTISINSYGVIISIN